MLKESHIESFFEKITVLERSLGSFAKFDFYKPIEFNPSDIVSIQKLGKSMAEFVGLSNLTFIIAIVPQKKNVGGHIDLSDTGNDVFIEISTDVAKYKDAILATLAHEISHKILALNGIRISVGSPEPIFEKENEVLTDITAVYSGFGKQMINGCECSISHEEPTIDGSRKITESIKTGYISQEQFSFIYLMICNMRKIEKRYYLSEINLSGKTALKNSLKENILLINDEFHNPNYFDSVNNSFDSTLLPLQKDLVIVRSLLNVIQHHCISVAESHLNKQHLILNKLQKQLSQVSITKSNNPSLNYLTNAFVYIEYQRIIENVEPLKSNSDSLIIGLNRIANVIKKVGGILYNSNLFTQSIINCKICSKEFKIPENKGLVKSKCPHCAYIQLVDTNRLDLDNFIKSTSSRFFKKIFNRKWWK